MLNSYKTDFITKMMLGTQAPIGTEVVSAARPINNSHRLRVAGKLGLETNIRGLRSRTNGFGLVIYGLVSRGLSKPSTLCNIKIIPHFGPQLHKKTY